MKRLPNLPVCLFCAALLLPLCGCGKGQKELRVATEATFPPYEFIEQGRIVGIDIDIVRAVAQELGYTLVIENMSFNEIFKAVQEGRCSVAASGITVTDERRELVSFTIPYVTAAQVIIVPKGSKLASPDALNAENVRIGVQRGTTGDHFVTKHLHEPQRFDNAEMAVSALLSGQLDAVVCDTEPADVHTYRHPDKLRTLPVALTMEEYAFALNRKDTQLLKQFNDELLKMRESGELQAIIAKYLRK